MAAGHLLRVHVSTYVQGVQAELETHRQTSTVVKVILPLSLVFGQARVTHGEVRISGVDSHKVLFSQRPRTLSCQIKPTTYKNQQKTSFPFAEQKTKGANTTKQEERFQHPCLRLEAMTMSRDRRLSPRSPNPTNLVFYAYPISTNSNRIDRA